MARSAIPESFTRYVLLLGAVGVLGVLYVILYTARRKLRKRFLDRPRLTFQQWYEEYYKDSDVSPEIAEKVLALVAKGIGSGVRPTQVLPTDRLQEDFTFRLCGTDIDDGIMLDHPLACLDDWLEDRVGEVYESNPNWRTVDDVIRDVSNHIDIT